MKSKSKPVDKKLQGKRNKQRGAAWELKVKAELETGGWFVTKFQCNVEDDKLITCKRKFNMFNKVMTIGTGFPDFMIWQKLLLDEYGNTYDVIGVECKSNGYLDKIEKEKCKWLLDNKVFSKILIAKKKKEGRRIVPEYIDFEEKYGKKKEEDNN